MSKLEISLKEITKYFRELSIVVIGVAITLSAGYWITGLNEKRDLKLYLNDVKLEIEENINYLNERKISLSKEFEYAEYLKSHEKNKLDFTVIKSFEKGGYADIEFIVFRTSAFEMFKVSGAMRLLENKKLLQKIWETYFWMGRYEISFDKLADVKLGEIKKWLAEKEKTPNIIPLYSFYVDDSYGYSDRLLSIIEEISETLKATLTELKKELND